MLYLIGYRVMLAGAVVAVVALQALTWVLLIMATTISDWQHAALTDDASGLDIAHIQIGLWYQCTTTLAAQHACEAVRWK